MSAALPRAGSRPQSLSPWGEALRGRLGPLLSRRLRRGSPLEEARTLTLVKCDNIGDFILATTFMGAAHERWKDREVTLVCSPTVVELARTLYPDWKIRAVPPPWVGPPGRFEPGSALGHDVARWPRADWMISLRPIRFREEVTLDGWVPARRKLAVSNQAWWPGGCSPKVEGRTYDELLAVPPSGDPAVCQDVADHRALLERCFPGAASNRTALPSFGGRLDPGGTRWFGCRARAGLDPRQPYLAVCPFPSYGIKAYPLDLLARAVETICGRQGLAAVILGGPADAAGAAAFAAGLRVPAGTINLAGRLELLDSTVVLEHAAGVLSVDTWAAHASIALAVPTVVIVGGGHFGQFGPWGAPERARWVTNRVPCFRCNWVCTQSRPVCIQDIPVESVTDVWEQVRPSP